MNHPPKICASCGREFEWRKKWEACWEEVKYCSKRCRGHRPGKLDQQIEIEILRLLRARVQGATICPSEVARKMFAEEDWREQMEVVRQAARRLVARGEIEITQEGAVVDPSNAKGPIRLRLT